MEMVSNQAAGEPSLNGPNVGWLVGLFVAFTVVTLVAFLTVYIGVQYGDPSWAANSYPPPLTH